MISVNILLERGDAEAALVATKGFRDILEIGRQDQLDLYVPKVPIGPDDVQALAATLHESDIETIAVSLLHAYADPENEETITEILREELDSGLRPRVPAHVDAYVRPAVDPTGFVAVTVTLGDR